MLCFILGTCTFLFFFNCPGTPDSLHLICDTKTWKKKKNCINVVWIITPVFILQSFFFLQKKLGPLYIYKLEKNIARLQKAAPRTSHPLLRCQVVLTKRNWGFSGLDFFSFVRILVFSFIRTKVFEFGHNLSLWILPQLEFLSVVTIWVFKLCHNLKFCVLSHFEFLSGHYTSDPKYFYRFWTSYKVTNRGINNWWPRPLWGGQRIFFGGVLLIDYSDPDGVKYFCEVLDL